MGRFEMRTDQPISGVTYRLTGGHDVPSIARGDALADCVVAPGITTMLLLRQETGPDWPDKVEAKDTGRFVEMGSPPRFACRLGIPPVVPQ